MLKWIVGTFLAPFVIFFVLLLYWLWSIAGPVKFETFRYRLTINVLVNGTPYSASSVIEARQEQGKCVAPGWGGSGASGKGCPPRFYAQGVAPMIVLPDGAVIYAGLTNLGWLPWRLYVDNWPKDSALAKLPTDTPTITLPFRFRTPPKRGFGVVKPFEPTVFWVPYQKLGPARGSIVTASNSKTVAGRNLQLVDFSISQTDGDLIVCLGENPPWLQSYRGGPMVSKSMRNQRRYREKQPVDMQTQIFDFESGGKSCRNG